MRRSELLSVPISCLGIYVVGLLAFTKKQRDSIAFERDGGHCQAPFPHKCSEEHLEVHHCRPQRYCSEVGIDPEYVDVPENAVTICSNAHDVIHPDRVQARKNYHQAKRKGEDSFKEMFEERSRKLKDRQIYWNDQYDRQLQVVAIRRTQEAKKHGWVFPERRKKAVR